ncbi:MAG: XRE family transcriptional regulator [Gammaproteobacteria bacterium]|nr:XRE family transcriptional regulator [Gammaproteobacteria bacterium]
MFSERLKRARKAAGLSMDALGKAVGLSANAIEKYEHGDTLPTSKNLKNLADALGVRVEYFFRPSKVEIGEIEYRKHSNAPKKLLDKITDNVLEQVERWTELLDLYPDTDKPIARFAVPSDLPRTLGTLDEVEDVAEHVRKEWRLGSNAIPDLIDTLESKGIMVITTSVENSEKFDGLAGSVNGLPVVVISTRKPGDRQRFTLAHELGHLILHGRVDALDEERACNRFAGALCSHANHWRAHFGEKRSAIEAQELYLLKHEFGVSMMAILMRLADCEVISETLKKNISIMMGKKGWRKREPEEQYANEETFLFKQLVYRALGEEYIGESKAAELLGMALAKFHKVRLFEQSDAGTD